MKRISFCFLFLFSTFVSSACTVCGCSASNQYLGILPQFHKHFVGLQYQFRSFQSEHPGHELNQSSSFSNEYYSTVQAWGRFNAGKRIQLFAFVPYISNIKKENGASTAINGLGDVTLLGNYRILGVNENPINTWQHNLQAGGGIKIPTGAYDKSSVQKAEGLPNMQPGTNSWDFIVNANYTLRRKKAGVNLDASYTLLTPNSLQYKYGNRLSAGLMGFYWYQKSNTTILPQIGLRYDRANADYDNYKYNIKSDMSGGEQLYVSTGVQAYYKRVGLQLMYHHPVMQHYASGLVTSKVKTEAGVYFLF
ncbi:MAG TPA: hypothetical protein PL009_02045 [Flavipsychrobacter sp.]|nr:hypothetical protein [Flavipsychrobacter sp.]